tara:strand:- start:23274 stop:24098 length:825 start_codon:yes stop_codon:yes gene_type:complete
MGGSTPSVNPNNYLPAYKSTSPDFTQWANLLGTSGTMADRNLSRATNTLPELRTADIPGLQEMFARETELNALKSKQLDEQLNPAVAAARELSKQRILADASEGPSTELSNIWTKLALGDTIATGANSDSGFARSALADATRRDYIQNRDLRTDRLLALSAANPVLQAGIDPSALASLTTGAKEQNMQNREAYSANNRAGTAQRAADLNNQFQQMLQALAQQRQFDTGQRNALAQARLTSAVNSANTATGASNSTTTGLIAGGGAIAAAALVAF